MRVQQKMITALFQLCLTSGASTDKTERKTQRHPEVTEEGGDAGRVKALIINLYFKEMLMDLLRLEKVGMNLKNMIIYSV